MYYIWSKDTQKHVEIFVCSQSHYSSFAEWSDLCTNQDQQRLHNIQFTMSVM